MENTNFYACPYCNQEGTITLANKLYDDLRYDSLKCPHCGAEWRVYYRVGGFVAEITHPPMDTTEKPTVEEASAVVDSPKSSYAASHDKETAE